VDETNAENASNAPDPFAEKYWKNADASKEYRFELWGALSSAENAAVKWTSMAAVSSVVDRNRA